MKKIFYSLAIIALLVSCNLEDVPDASFAVTMTGDGIAGTTTFTAATAVGKVGDSIEIIAGDTDGAIFRVAVPFNGQTGTYNAVVVATTASEAEIQYTPEPSDILKFSVADSGTLNITKIDDEGTENLIDGNFNVKTVNLSGDTIRMQGDFVSIPIILE
ncbi:MAG TPA: hypothetical protein VEB42_03445 [Chitinophagaceae bacterium]|nr:hypothetical protein [Chitinophagaceae bacterium]